MTEPEVLDSMNIACDRLGAIRAGLQGVLSGKGSQDLLLELGSVQSILDELRSRYGLLREVLDEAGDMVFAKDLDGRYVVINPRGAAMIGRTTSEVLGRDDRTLYESSMASRIMAEDRQVMSTGAPSTREDSDSHHGARRLLHTTTIAWRSEERVVRGVIGITRDVTESRRGEEVSLQREKRLRSLAAEIIGSEELLRHSVALELHSGIGQDITLAKLKICMLRDTAGAQLREPLSDIERLLEQADRSLRALALQLSPPVLHDLGLFEALQWLAEEQARKYQIDVHVRDGGSPVVTDEQLRVLLFRFVRELIEQAATLAGARSVSVELAGSAGRVLISVLDTGTWHATDALDARGQGLFGIRELLQHAGGTLNIESKPDGGTTVTLTSPTTRATSAASGSSAAVPGSTGPR